MSERNNKAKNRTSLAFLLGLTVVALYLCYVLIAPFLKLVLFSAVLAILFYPLHSHIRRRIRNLPHGAIQLDRKGNILKCNLTESQLANLDRAPFVFGGQAPQAA